MKKTKHGNKYPHDTSIMANNIISAGTIQLTSPNADFTIKNENGDLYIEAKRVFINGKEFK